MSRNKLGSSVGNCSMRETRSGFQLMILLYSVHDIRSRFSLPPTYRFSLDREPPEQEQSWAAPQKTPQSEEQAYLVQRASWPHLCHIRVDGMCYRRGQNLPLETRHAKKIPFPQKLDLLPHENFCFLLLLSVFLKTDVWLLTACWSLVWKDPSHILDLLISWSWGYSPKHWSCSLSSESERESFWHPGHHSDDTIY